MASIERRELAGRRVQPIDVRTFASRAACETAGVAAPSECLDLVCVEDLTSLVDRDELLRNATGAEPPYWALPWLGARAIAAHMRRLSLPTGTRVLDLGCGLGLSGIAAGLAGGRVTFTDYVADALSFADENARRHRLRDFEILELDFTRDRLPYCVRWILAADVVYDPAHYDGLVAFLDAHLDRDGTLLLTESLRADASVVIDRLASRGIRGPREGLWLQEEGRAERIWLHVLARV